ncbi:hypothetical protein AAFF_G00219410 [Aldrovandia affinis]|uniref:Uncharacterized protein n=1 Tax=Aldrovandia affinis TaxID=143900 RepID=A0AAD7W453_9TELE|nr:hypothetical protein AAFF_G00219410 [Aldrovandia affinis]
MCLSPFRRRERDGGAEDSSGRSGPSEIHPEQASPSSHNAPGQEDVTVMMSRSAPLTQAARPPVCTHVSVLPLRSPPAANTSSRYHLNQR